MNNLYEELIEYAESRVKNSCFTVNDSVKFDYNYFTTGTPAIEMAEFMYEKTLSNLNPVELARFVWCMLDRYDGETAVSDTFRGMEIID